MESSAIDNRIMESCRAMESSCHYCLIQEILDNSDNLSEGDTLDEVESPWEVFCPQIIWMPPSIVFAIFQQVIFFFQRVLFFLFISYLNDCSC